MVEHLPWPISDPEAALDVNLGYPIDDDNNGRDGGEEGVAADPAQRAATLTMLTFRSLPSILSVSVEAPSGASSFATATASVSFAI